MYFTIYLISNVLKQKKRILMVLSTHQFSEIISVLTIKGCFVWLIFKKQRHSCHFFTPIIQRVIEFLS
jgi:hypothetical protein